MSYGIVDERPINTLPPTRSQLAHKKAMIKFMERWKKWVKGFDFTIAWHRREEFIGELFKKDLFWEEIAWSRADIQKRKRKLSERFKNLLAGKFGKIGRYGGLQIVGVGIDDLVREDFFDKDGKPIHHVRTACYSIAPTKELLDKREEGR